MSNPAPPLNPLAASNQDPLVGAPANGLLNVPFGQLTPPMAPADVYEADTKAYGDWLAQERASGVAAGLIDPNTGWPTQAAILDAAHQFGSALIGGTAAPAEAVGPVLAYHGTMSGDIGDAFLPGSHFGTVDAAHARIADIQALPAGQRPDPTADAPAVYPVRLAVKNPIDTPDLGDFETPDLAMHLYGEGLIDDHQLQQMQEGELDPLDALHAMGHDAIRYVNTMEDPGSTSYMVVDPSIVSIGHHAPPAAPAAAPPDVAVATPAAVPAPTGPGAAVGVPAGAPEPPGRVAVASVPGAPVGAPGADPAATTVAPATPANALVSPGDGPAAVHPDAPGAPSAPVAPAAVPSADAPAPEASPPVSAAPANAVAAAGEVSAPDNALLPAPIVAYHGSPHSFDQFESSAIGTGEGAQAYGHGLYFADHEATARSYRDGLSGSGVVITRGGQTIGQLPRTNISNDPDWMNAYRSLMPVADVPDWIKSGVLRDIRGQGLDLGQHVDLGAARAASVARVTDEMANFAPAMQQRAVGEVNKAYDSIGGDVQFRVPGHMYEVGIHADPGNFLDWDKRISTQSPTVQSAARALLPADPEVGDVGTMTGSEFHERLARANGIAGTGFTSGSPSTGYRKTLMPDYAAAASLLGQKGVAGIRHLDGGSRASGEGTSNYVVFDPATVAILRKYGIVGLVGGGAAAAAGSQQAPTR